MSGAEAIFGVVSGGAGLISLSIQLTESAVKLRRIISTAKDAPQTISTYIFHLETMALVLQQLEQHRQHDTYNEPLLKQCIKECQESTSRIGQEVDKIIHYMAARNNKVWGRLYAVYKEPKVRELFDNLERAKSSLMLAYMGYLEAGQRRQYETINNTLALQTTVLQAQVAAGNADGSQQLSQLLSSSTSSGKHLRQGSRPTLSWQAKRKDRKSNIRIVLPSWLCNRVWEVAISQSQSSWGITIHTYNVVPKDSLIIKYCQLGDVGGIRRLVKSREGSLFDTTELSVPGEYWTLLELAANEAQLEVCRYLLNEIDWPDQAGVLNRALGNFGRMIREKETSIKMYRLFLEAPGFNADLDDVGVNYRWLGFCRNTLCLDLILENLQPRFDFLPPNARFELVTQIGSGLFLRDPSGFLKYIGLQQSDQRLASLKSSGGSTPILHYIAHILRLGAFFGLGHDDLQGWLNIGLNVLRNGADPSCTARGISQRLPSVDASVERDEKWLSTPLIHALDIMGETFSDLSHWKAEKLELIQIWAEMIQRAGLDLLEYGDKESKAWQTLNTEDTSDMRLVYGATPADWSVMICSPPQLHVSMLRSPPGAFYSRNPLTTIIWKPTEEEKDEGPWEIAEEQIIPSSYWDLKDIVFEPREPFEELINSVHDDLGVIMLIQYRASHPRHSTRRSYSQPRPLDHRNMAYGKIRVSDRRPWLGSYHLCHFNAQWRLCSNNDIDENMPEIPNYGLYEDPRHCVEGRSNECHSVQESHSWLDRSYLQEIALCQDERPFAEWDKSWMWHFAAMSYGCCPYGCSKVHLNRLRVPEALRPYHPGRRYEAKFEKS